MTYAAVVKLGLALPDVDESTSYGTPSLKVNGAMMTRLWEDGTTVVMRATFEAREALIAEAPDTYYLTDHYRNYPAVLVRLPKIRAYAMRDLLRGAHGIASMERRPRKKPSRKR